MSKRVLALVVATVLVFSLAGCNSKSKDGDKINKNEASQSQKDKETSKLDKNKTEGSSSSKEDKETNSDMPSELSEAIDSIIASTLNGEDILDKTVDYSNEAVNEVKYYNSDLLNKGMTKSDTFNILVKSEEIEVTEAVKVSKSEWEVTVANEMADSSKLQFIKVEDKWLMNINSMVTFGKLDIANNVKLIVNGIEVPVEYIESKAATSMYKIPGLLVGVTNTLEHETGLSEEVFKAEFIASSDEAIRLRYEISEADLANILPEMKNIFNDIYAATLANDAAKIGTYLADNAKVDANAIKNGLSNTGLEGYTLTNLDKRSDKEAKDKNICFLSGKDEYTLNLVAKMAIGGGTFKGSAPTEYNWVIVSKTEAGLKIVDCSSSLWMNKVNPYSNDV